MKGMIECVNGICVDPCSYEFVHLLKRNGNKYLNQTYEKA